MSSVAWILVLVFLTICPYNATAKDETACSCQQSGLGPFEPSSENSHQSGHSTSEHYVSSSETSAPNGPFESAETTIYHFNSNTEKLVNSPQQLSVTVGQLGQSQPLGQGVEQLISYNKSVAAVLPLPIGQDIGRPAPFSAGAFGQSGSSSNRHVSITFGQPAQSNSFGEGFGQYNEYNSPSVSAETKPSQFGPNGGEAVSSGSTAFGETVPSLYQEISGSAAQYATSSDQSGDGPVGSSGSKSDQNGSNLFKTSETNSGTFTPSGSYGTGQYLKYSTSSVGQMAEEPETRPSPTGPYIGGSNPFSPGPFGQLGSSSSMVQNKISGQDLGQFNTYSSSVAGTNPFQLVSEEGGGEVSSGSVAYDQSGPSLYQQISDSVGQYATGSNEAGSSPVGLSGSNISVQNGSSLFGTSETSSGTSTPGGSFNSGQYLKYSTSLVGQMKKEPETRPSPTGPYIGGPNPFSSGPFGQLGSSSSLGQSKTFGEGLGQYKAHSNSVLIETKPFQFGSDGGGAVSSGSVALGQQGQNSYQQASSSVKQLTANANQPGRGPIGLSGSSSVRNGSSLFETSETSLGSSKSNGLFGTGHYLKYSTSSVGQMAEEPEKKPSSTGAYTGQPSPFSPGPFGQSESSSNKQVSITFGQLGQTKTIGEGLGQFIQNGTSVATETQPLQFGSGGEVKVSAGYQAYGKPGPTSYQQISGSFGPYTAISDQPGLGSARPLILNAVEPETGLFGPSEASKGTSTQNESFESGLYVAPIATQTAEATEARPSSIWPNKGGSSGNSGYSLQQYESTTFAQTGQIKSSEAGLGKYNPYTNSVAAAEESGVSKPSQFVQAGEEVPSGFVSFWQQRPSSDQQITGSVTPLNPSLFQAGNGLFGPSESSLGTSAPNASIESKNYLKYSTSKTTPTAYAGLSPVKPDEGALDPFRQAGFSSHQHVPVTFKQSGNIKSFGQGLGQYTPYSYSTAEMTPVDAETKPSPYRLYRGALTPSVLGPSGPSESSSKQPRYGPFETTGTSLNHDGSGAYGPHTLQFKPIEQGPYMQYATTSASLAAEEADKEPSTFLKTGDITGPTVLSPFWPSVLISYKPASVPFSSSEPSGDHSAAESFGVLNPIVDKSALGLYDRPEKNIGDSVSSGLQGQGSYVPYTISTEAAVEPAGQPIPGLFGLSGSSNIITVPSGPFGLGPALYVPYRNAEGAASIATAEPEPSLYESYKGEADLSGSSLKQSTRIIVSPSTPISNELSTGQSTGVSESSGQLGAGLNNSLAPQETTKMVAVSPADKKAVLKSASRLSSLLTTARVSTAISFLMSSGGFNPSSLSKVISYLIKSIPETQPGLSGDETLHQALLEVISSLLHILSSASIGEVGSCPSSSSSLVAQSVTRALGS